MRELLMRINPDKFVEDLACEMIADRLVSISANYIEVTPVGCGIDSLFP